ncbi:hypothetical protein [Tardiphaga sp.]|uniref:hypothetical protein n=1 Tax=Tardiphaga sp. TaxID=1926292 RepID=UPI00352A0117
MSNILNLSRSNHALERIGDRSELMEFDAGNRELQAAMRDVIELRAKAKQRFDDAIVALELGCARLPGAMNFLGEGARKAKRQRDLSSVERQLKHPRSNLVEAFLALPNRTLT